MKMGYKLIIEENIDLNLNDVIDKNYSLKLTNIKNNTILLDYDGTIDNFIAE